jgi:hypothetical protein
MSRLFDASRFVFYRLATGGFPTNAYFPFRAEQAIGAHEPDPKSYIEYVPETNLPEPLTAAAADVHGLLLSVLRRQTAVISREAAPMNPKRFATLLQRAPPPILRITFYPSDKGREVANYPHTDIDLVTLLPRATEPGLQVALDDGWHEIQIDAESVVVLTGEMLELMGGPSAEMHRVMGDKERFSVSFFVNASSEERLPNGELTGAVVEERLRKVRGAGEHK